MFAQRWLSVLCAVSLWGISAATTAQIPTTPIKYLVVIFQENNSFDHYFGAYPVALNPAGDPAFHALATTPTVNGFGLANGGNELIALNPNQNGAPLTNPAPGQAQPFRLDRGDAVTCDNDNAYDAEQEAYDSGLVDMFPQKTSAQPPTLNTTTNLPCDANLAMGYYDGNTVTALWNYAQHYAISDNFYDTEFGTTVMGHINLISGQTHQTGTADVAGKIQNGSIIANVDPVASLDDCVSGTKIQMTSKNVGDLLNAQNPPVTWGWFYGDFNSGPTAPAACSTLYDAHYDPFQYYTSTANPHHLQPTSTALIGTSADQANHQYDLNAFSAALANGNLPAVTFLKASVPQTGHPQKSSPLAEQEFLATVINQLMNSYAWPNMAIIIAWDDSDGWYDHVMPPIVNQSNDPTVDHACKGPIAAGAFNDRCGYGTRLPFVVISPYAKSNYVDHTVTDLASILRFVEQNWSLGYIDGPTAPPPGQASFDRTAGSIMGLFNFGAPANLKKLIIDPNTGLVTSYQ